jgi:hypothetical protein
MAPSMTAAATSVGADEGAGSMASMSRDAWRHWATLSLSTVHFYDRLVGAEWATRELVVTDAQFRPVVRAMRASMVNLELVIAVLRPVPAAVLDAEGIGSRGRTAPHGDTIDPDGAGRVRDAWQQLQVVRNSGAQLYGRLRRAAIMGRNLATADERLGPIDGVMTAAGVNVRLVMHLVGELRPPAAIARFEHT